MTLLVVVVVAHGPECIGVVVILVFMFVLQAPPGIAVTAGIITKVSGPVCIGGGCEGSATDLG